MENIRLVDTSLKMVFEEGTSEDENFRREFMSLLMLHDDPLSVWLKSDKIRKESEDTDKILLTLIAELHRKVDILSLRLTTEGPLYLPLRYQAIHIRLHSYYKTLKHNQGKLHKLAHTCLHRDHDMNSNREHDFRISYSIPIARGLLFLLE